MSLNVDLDVCVVTLLLSVQIFGPTMLKWLCPSSVGHLKDGISFPILRDSS